MTRTTGGLYLLRPSEIGKRAILWLAIGAVCGAWLGIEASVRVPWLITAAPSTAAQDGYSKAHVAPAKMKKHGRGE